MRKIINKLKAENVLEFYEVVSRVNTLGKMFNAMVVFDFGKVKTDIKAYEAYMKIKKSCIEAFSKEQTEEFNYLFCFERTYHDALIVKFLVSMYPDNKINSFEERLNKFNNKKKLCESIGFNKIKNIKEQWDMFKELIKGYHAADVFVIDDDNQKIAISDVFGKPSASKELTLSKISGMSNGLKTALIHKTTNFRSLFFELPLNELNQKNLFSTSYFIKNTDKKTRFDYDSAILEFETE